MLKNKCVYTINIRILLKIHQNISHRCACSGYIEKAKHNKSRVGSRDCLFIAAHAHCWYRCKWWMCVCVRVCGSELKGREREGMRKRKGCRECGWHPCVRAARERERERVEVHIYRYIFRAARRESVSLVTINTTCVRTDSHTQYIYIYLYTLSSPSLACTYIWYIYAHFYALTLCCSCAHPQSTFVPVW